MKTKDFFAKFLSGYLWGNLLAMALVVVVIGFGVKYGLEYYTHHDESIKIPDLSKMDFDDARLLLESDGLIIQVSDSGYNKRLPAYCILAQTPDAGNRVKQGRVIYVTVNSPSSPSFAIPDLVDNSSYREAAAKLMALGFKLLPPQYIPGEKNWVYGILSRGRHINTGDVISTNYPLTLQVGNGQYGEEDDINYLEPEYHESADPLGEGDIDEFEEVDGPDE